MAGKVIFAVSTPCNTKGKASGYRLVLYSEERLSILPYEKGDPKSDVDINVQAFCYLKPKDRGILPECVNTGLMDSSDYMLFAKSSGFIEIVQDYQYKIQNNLSLTPSYILKCTPEGYPDFRSDSMVAGLQYREGLLYCCMCSGKIYIFVLNLPHDYIQSENSFVPMHSSDLFYHGETQLNAPVNRDSHMLEEATFYLNMKFTGRSRLKHICYYLLPMEPEHLRISPSIFLFGNSYNDRIIFKPSIFVELDQGVSGFRINPLDRFSFFTVSPRSALMIRKIMLPMAYVDFFGSFVNKKRIIQETKPEEIVSWNKVAEEMGYDSLISWILEDPLHELDNAGSFAWEELARYDGISILRTIIVWIQRQSHAKDDIYKIFHHGDRLNSNNSSRSNSSEPRSPGRIRRSPRYGFRRGGLREPVDLPCSTNWELDSFIRDVRKNTFTVDFKVVQSSFDSNHDETLERPSEDESTRTSFLTDNYKNMDIVCIDRYLSLSAFRPKYLDVPLTRVDSFQNCVEHDGIRRSLMANENSIFRRAMSNLSSFKKLFMLTESLCMVLDTNGVLLIDRYALADPKNVIGVGDRNSAIKVATFNIGLISDAILVVKTLEGSSNDACSDIFYNLIVTCIPGEILALKGSFSRNSNVGEITLCDSLRLNRKNRFVDKVCLVNYESYGGDRKRFYRANEPMTKRSKWE